MTLYTCENRMINTDMFFGFDRVTTEYEINEKKRTIVCIITAINDVPLRLSKYGLWSSDEDEEPDIRVYKGVAKCAPEDKWDPLYGRRLAEYRASRARQVDVNNELTYYINTLSKRIDNLYDYGLMKHPHIPNKER